MPEIPAIREHGGRLWRAARPDAAGRRVLALVLVMLGAGAGLWFAVVPGLSVGGDRWMPWWALGALFAAAEICVLHVQVRREARTISLSDIPLVIGLFLATPGALVAGRVVLPLLVFVFIRRAPLIKVLFNVALLLVESLTATVVFGSIVGSQSPNGPIGWVAGCTAAGVGGTLSAGLVAVVIAINERRANRRDSARTVFSGFFVAVLVATPALVAVEALESDRRAFGLLAICATVVFIAYRAYASLNERHLGLERLYEFSQVVGNSSETDEVVRSLLLEAQDVLHAETAQLSIVDGTHGRLRVSSSGLGALRYETIGEFETTDWVWTRVVVEGEALLLPRGSRDAGIRRYLERRGWREALVVPMRGENAVIGTLAIADRLGDVRTFDQSDAQLLATIANQASVALQNGRLFDRLRHEAMHDALTGLANRRKFQESVTGAIAGSGDGGSVAVLALELDGLQEINDTLGHQYGDTVIAELAQRLASRIGDDAVVARLSDDEFAVVLEVSDIAAATGVARALMRCLEEPVYVESMALEVGGAVGIALAPDHTDDGATLLKYADLAMYAAKRSAARWAIFESLMDSSSPQRLAVLAELRQAVQEDGLQVFVQPKADMRTGDVNSVEALVRWPHRERGFIPPDDFIPLAERSGLIRPLTSYVLRTALLAAAQWRRHGEQLGVAVNLSARSLLDPDLVSEVEHMLRLNGFPAQLLTLEITEGSLMSDTPRAVSQLDRLHDLGVQLSIDDFGTGYSALSYLKRLPVDEVKIDRSFIANLAFDDSDAAIVRSVVDLGTNLSLHVVAEGVEDQHTWERLVDMGCELAQGYYLGRPMPIDDFPTWLAAYRAEQPNPRGVISAIG